MAVITFAHRGARLVAPENTIPAFAEALRQGATGLETDVWCAADGEVVCAHDAVVRRGVRRARIPATSAADLAPFGVPRLADVYAELGTGFELSVDVKAPEAARPLVDVACRHGAGGRLWVCHPDVGLLRDLRAAADGVRLVHSTRRKALGPLERHASDLADAGIDAVNLHHSEWSAGLVALFHRFGVLAFAWDVQEVRHLRAALGMGVDALYCDRPDRMAAVVGEWAPGGTPPVT